MKQYMSDMSNKILTRIFGNLCSLAHEPMFIGPRTYVHRLMNPITPKGGSLQAKRQGRGSLCSLATTLLRPCSSKRAKLKLRLVISLLLMISLGATNAWGQTTDYSGTYYIASNYIKNKQNKYNPNNLAENFYLCPTEGWISFDATGETKDTWTTGDDKPFLTTHKINADDNYVNTKAKWTIEYYTTEDGRDYYYFKHSSGKYMVLNQEITGTNNSNRIRVHLEFLTSANLEDATTRNKALFAIVLYKGYTVISPKNTSAYYLTVNKGNGDPLTGENRDNGGTITSGTTTYGLSGTIGIYNSIDDANAPFYFEDIITRPTITYNDASDEITITAVQSGATLIYTTDGSTPTTSNGTQVNNTTITINPSDGETTIKAVAVVNNELSNIAKFTTPVFFGSNHKYLIQSQNNAWNTTDFHFYMIPGDEDNSVIKVNTTSLFRPTMEWYFLNAGDGYCYIVNNSAKDNSNNPYYLCWDGTNVSMLAFDSGDVNKFKFSIVESPTAGTFNILPYGETKKFINKGSNSGNAAADVIGLRTESTTYSNNANARWRFIASSTLDKTAPFTVSDGNNTFYYKIASVGSSGYYIVPPSGNNTNATTSNSESDAMKWYFEVAQDADASDWCTYYHIRNVETGKYLYFTKDANNSGACLVMKDDIESGYEDRYMFTWARTATERTYYIIPKLVKDVSMNQISSLQRDGNTLKSNITRSAGNYAWTFNLFCNNPTFEESEGNIIISCITNAAEIRYTINGEDPGDHNVTYFTYPPANPLSTSVQTIVKAIAVVNDGYNTGSSSVATLLNMPDITLEAGPYTYKGSAWEPTITVSIGGTTAPTSPASYSVTYINNINAGLSTDANPPTVNVNDVDEEDNLYIWNASTTFTINPATLTITADAKTKEYGDPDPELTYSESGLFEGDELTGALSRAVGEDVNESPYPITQGSLTAGSNYTIDYTGANLTITKKSIVTESGLAAGISVEIVEDGAGYTANVKHYGIDLTPGEANDYTVTVTPVPGSTRYYTVELKGSDHNYRGTFSGKYAIVDFGTHDEANYSGTFISDGDDDDDYATPSGMTAYIVTGIDEQTVTITQVDYIPKNVPVLLLTNVDAKGFFVNAKGEEPAADTSSNILEVVTDNPSKHFDTGEIYLLYKDEFVLNMDGYLDKGKIYLPVPSGSAPARLRIGRSQSTGIDNCQLSTVNCQPPGIWYTLDGRRLSGKPTKKGLYLQNGKKMVVR